jgi:hypothetical protein
LLERNAVELFIAKAQTLDADFPLSDAMSDVSGVIKIAPSGSEHPTNQQSGRSTSASEWSERVAQVRTRGTAPPDQSAADPSSLPVSQPRNGMNQRTPCASTGEFFNTIRAKTGLPQMWLLTQCRLQELCFVGNEEDVRSRSHGG